MSKQPSDPPNGIKIYVPPKLAIIALAVLVGGGAGGLGISRFFDTPDSKAQGKEPSRGRRDQAFLITFDKMKTDVKTNTDDIKTINDTVGQIQTVQNSDIARTEARRVTREIKSRIRREREYDRLVSRNLIRLEKGADPCQDLQCSE